MKNSISLFSILFALCVFTQNIHAQSDLTKIIRTDKVPNSGFFDVKVTNFLFKKVDDNNNVVAFTEADAQKLYAFFEKETGVVYVESHTIDKSIKVISLIQTDGKSLFDYKVFVDMLDQLGYIVTQLRCKTQKQYIASTLSKEENKIMVQIASEKETECNDCNNLKISKEDLEMFRNMDYGGSVIQIDLGSDSGSIIDMN
ncbi:MAG: hypothetical protein R3E32_16585 [Chitinophagales bacterium]